MTEEHPFAQYVRILGKGPNLSRPLSLEEATDAARMVMAGEVEPVQLGAFLCLLRVKTETPQEIAGLARAARETVAVPPGVAVELDWAAWAGKSRQLPYFLLAALTLAQYGVRVFMHGAEGHTAGRLYASKALAALGVPASTSTDDAARRLECDRFAYMTLADLSPRLHQLIGLKALLGLRSPLHTAGRLLNPLGAPFLLSAVTHPPYLEVQQEAAQILGQRGMASFKGEGGEVERRPEKPCEVFFLEDGHPGREEWPALMTGARAKEDSLDPARLLALWRDEEQDEIAAATITATIAIALKYAGRADTIGEAEDLAAMLWRDRDTRRVPGAS